MYSSYSKEKAAPVIRRVLENGFDVGVHGVDYQNAAKMQAEHDAFMEIFEAGRSFEKQHEV